MYQQYSRMLADSGFNVVCIVPPNAMASAELRHYPNIILLEDERVYLNKGKIVPFTTRRLRKVIEKYNIQVVLAHSGGLTRLFKKVCQGERCKVVAVNHNTNPKQSARGDYAIATNRPIWNEITGAFGMPEEQAKLLFNFTTIPDEAPTPQPFHSPPVIGYLGRMDANKNVDTMIHALSHLKADGVDFTARLGGDGPARDELEALTKSLGLEDRVKFVGWVNDKAAFFDTIDIFGFCSFCEAFPLVMLEATQYGKPLISSDFAGADDLVTNGESGLLYPRSDAKAMADACKRLMADEPLSHRLAANAFVKAKRCYSTEVAQAELDQFIRDIL